MNKKISGIVKTFYHPYDRPMIQGGEVMMVSEFMKILMGDITKITLGITKLGELVKQWKI